MAVLLQPPRAGAAPFAFSTGQPDGKLGALSQPATGVALETETADDFVLTDTTRIDGAIVVGLIPVNAALEDIANVEVEIYHVFPTDSADPPSGKVPARVNSPADVEIDSATRDGAKGSLLFTASVLNPSFATLNSVATHLSVGNGGDGAANGQAIRIGITFQPPIVLPPDHYFFRPEVEVTNWNFLYLSAPKPVVTPGTPFAMDLQAWIRNTALKPDWLRIGTDIVGGATPPTFNMTFSLIGETLAEATPTSTPLPTATPKRGSVEDDGCAITAHSPTWHTAWLLVAPALWCWRRRRHR
jgi:hypothetical protein